MKFKALCAVLLPVLAVGSYCLWPSEETTQGNSSAESSEVAADGGADDANLPAEIVELAVAVEQKTIAAEFTGNGRERLSVAVTNPTKTPLKIVVPVGQTFESERNLMIVVRPAEIEVRAGKTAEVIVQTAAVRSANKVLRRGYQLSSQVVPRIELFLTYVQQHPELTPAAVQTAILALTDNLPLSAVAKFQLAGGALPSRFNTDAFRVETPEIVSALASLKTMGMRDFQIAMTIDPQLKIESMIDPLSRPIAMRYYGISAEAEWDFWKKELLHGEPATRHYALYGIARFYPEVALQMLPKWVRETRTNPVYRMSAAQALADTQKPEALPILRQLVEELGPQSSLGLATNAAADHLDYRLAQLAATRTTVAFRTTEGQAKTEARF
jgi:hypothetical protein